MASMDVKRMNVGEKNYPLKKSQVILECCEPIFAQPPWASVSSSTMGTVVPNPSIASSVQDAPGATDGLSIQSSEAGTAIVLLLQMSKLRLVTA